jgi:amidophosphoribosyltransferase
MCGIWGLLLGNTKTAAVPELLEAGIVLQHRGQDAAGIATSDEYGHSYHQKGDGLIADVFGTKGIEIKELKGHMGVGHCTYTSSFDAVSSFVQLRLLISPVRYPTSGSLHCSEAQPFVRQYPLETYLVHVSTPQLAQENRV